VTGFAKVAGDLIEGLRQVLPSSAGWPIATVMCSGTRAACAARAGGGLLAGRGGLAARLLPLLGYALDPYSVLVPFLVFAIGMSHGAQKMNGIMQDIGRGAHRWWPRASPSAACSWPA
jgi:hypothetical protein